MTRRDLGRLMTAGVGALSWRGAAVSAQTTSAAASARSSIIKTDAPPVLFRLSSNENNYGLAPAAFDALKAGRSYANRYGAESTSQLIESLAKAHGVQPENILLAPGSGEILRAATLAFTSPGKGLLTASPTFEAPTRAAATTSAPIQAVRVAHDGTLDLTAMLAAATGTGMAFLCNPNNPTGGINSAAAIRDFIVRFRAAAPDGYILVDEAYADYVSDSSYASAVPLIQSDKRILVSRTFSKIHGMAGLRVGYAIGDPEALALLRAKASAGTLSSVSAGAALASLRDQAHLDRQRAFNREARAFTRQAFEKAGYTVLPSEGNFVMVDVRRESTVFQQVCRQAGVAISRPFPPLTTYARITIGTVEEMKKAVAIMLPLLSAPSPTTTASGSRDEDASGC
jgi:histidinol-phosphate aminotransferase